MHAPSTGGRYAGPLCAVLTLLLATQADSRHVEVRNPTRLVRLADAHVSPDDQVRGAAGDHAPRPIAQSFGLYQALENSLVPAEFYAIATGGHFPDDPVNQINVFERRTQWLAAHLN